jgi:hypothetical protein
MPQAGYASPAHVPRVVGSSEVGRPFTESLRMDGGPSGSKFEHGSGAVWRPRHDEMRIVADENFPRAAVEAIRGSLS